MAIEIEKKFLVCGDFKKAVKKAQRITQGYLSSVPERTVRVRIKGEKAYLTIKGIGGPGGISRFEWEREITVDDAESLLAICEPGVIDKTRNIVKVGTTVFEVDEFHGENQGLILAEVELQAEDQVIAHPDWLGEEVTGDPKYYNATLSKNPYTKWLKIK